MKASTFKRDGNGFTGIAGAFRDTPASDEFVLITKNRGAMARVSARFGIPDVDQTKCHKVRVTPAKGAKQ